MASVLRTVAQIPARTKYLVAITNPTSNSAIPENDSCLGLEFTDLTKIPSSLVAATGSEITGGAVYDYAEGDLFKDLGRQLVIYNSVTGAHLAVFRQVQPVDGAGVEGVPVDYTTARFIKVWSASGAGVAVARTGPGAQ